MQSSSTLPFYFADSQPQRALNIKILSQPRIQPATLPQNVFEEITAEE